MNKLNFMKIKPMLLIEKDKSFNDKNYFYELKFDGIRALIYVDKNDIIIKSRNNTILNNIFPELLNIKNNIKNKCIFDGEIVLMDNNKPSFEKVRSRMNLRSADKINYYKENEPVVFVCFDILYRDTNLMDLSLLKRKEILNRYKDTKYFIKSRVIEENGIKLFNFVKKNNLEGIVAKSKDSKYIPNIRSDDWIKIKNLLESDYYICGYKERDYIVSLLLGEKNKSDYNFVGKVILKKNSKEFNLIKKSVKSRNMFKDFYEEDYIYIKPKYKCIVSYLEKSNNNHLRHTVFKGLVN